MMKFTMLILRRRGFASQEAESAPSLNTRLTCPLVSGSAWIVSNALRHTRAALMSLSGTGRTAGPDTPPWPVQSRSTRTWFDRSTRTWFDRPR